LLSRRRRSSPLAKALRRAACALESIAAPIGPEAAAATDEVALAAGSDEAPGRDSADDSADCVRQLLRAQARALQAHADDGDRSSALCVALPCAALRCAAWRALRRSTRQPCSAPPRCAHPAKGARARRLTLTRTRARVRRLCALRRAEAEALVALCAGSGLLCATHAHALSAPGALRSELAVSACGALRLIGRLEAERKTANQSRRFYNYLRRFDFGLDEIATVLPLAEALRH
jgi:hypothetical protein